MGEDPLWLFHNPAGQYGVYATFVDDGLGGAHIYGESPDPMFPNVPVFPYDLMNPGQYNPPKNQAPGDPRPITRSFISDVDAMILADAYGYKVKLPSTFNTAFTTLDSETGTLLVQGLAGIQNSIVVDKVGSNFRARVNGTTELVPVVDVTKIVIARNGINDSITATGVGVPAYVPNYVVSSNQDSANAGVLGDGLVDLDAVVAGAQVSLRAAIRDANAAAAPGKSIYVPRGNYKLTLAGTGGDDQGDFDITNYVRIVGSGPGSTIIAAGGIDRIFDVASGGNLNLQFATLTGGFVNGENGGAIIVRNGGTITTARIAIVENTVSNGNGGAVYFEPQGGGSISDAVLTANYASNLTGGVYLAAAGSGPEVGIARAIIANNSAGQSGDVDVFAEPGRAFTSDGYNRLTSGGAGFVDGVNGDRISATVNYVVTGVTDEFNHANDGVSLSLREAIDQANTTSGTQEIWLPSWTFLLTRVRQTTTSTDTSAMYGDLDISDSLVIRGVDGFSKIRWRSGVVDKVFELLGDYNNNGLVDAADYTIWQDTLGSITDLRADGDDNGVVNQSDYSIWTSSFGRTLSLLGVS